MKMRIVHTLVMLAMLGVIAMMPIMAMLGQPHTHNWPSLGRCPTCHFRVWAWQEHEQRPDEDGELYHTVCPTPVEAL